MGFDETNAVINNRIHQIASKFSTNEVTTLEKNELATLIYPKLQYYIWKFCNNHEDTEEALQWALKRIFKNIHMFDSSKARFTTWSYRIARNETLFYLHKKQKRKKHECVSEYEEKDTSTECNIEVEECMELMYNETITEIHNIDDKLLRNIAIDKMIKNEKIRCIATRYDINENTVKTKLRKIRTDLKTRVLENNPDFKETLNKVFEI